MSYKLAMVNISQYAKKQIKLAMPLNNHVLYEQKSHEILPLNALKIFYFPFSGVLIV
jgi:hypothetical protein